MAAATGRGQAFFASLLGDGRPALFVLASGLLASGLAALLLAATGRFLPHDEQFLGMTAGDLCAFDGCKVVHFMIHDRASFGGVLVAVGVLYLWLVAVPLGRGEAWAWWTLFSSGAVGFASFLSYLGFGYFDTWHALGTLVLLPCYVVGLACSRSVLAPPAGLGAVLGGPALIRSLRANGAGWVSLSAAAVGILGAGLTILTMGMTVVFVPQDLAYLGVRPEDLHALNPRLVPLIAHDRAGFGGALCSCGIALALCLWRGRPSRSLWRALTLAGVAGFVPAIGVHPAIGYNDPVHLAPAVVGATLYLAGLALTYRRSEIGESGEAPISS
jgi:hypothetical protein